jgi:hypothetical protein
LLERLPDRAKTPRVARAITSPSGILLAGAGASAAILGGLPLIAAAGIGLAAWAARVALALPRKAPEDRIQPERLAEPWRSFVREAQDAARRYRRAVAATAPGPLRERLADIGTRIDTGVLVSWRVAKRGDALEGALGEMDLRAVADELRAVEAEAAARRGPQGASLERTAAALRAQLSSASRLGAVAAEARDRLRLLDARLDEAVARAVELSLGAGDVSAAGGLQGDVEQLVEEMEALRAALDDAGPTPSASPAA